MDDQFDNDLKKHIKEVFENFKDPSADEGWLLLREKFPEEKEKRRAFAWLWWGAAAALLLLFLSFGLWMYLSKPQYENFSVKTPKHAPAQSLTATDSPKVAAGRNMAATAGKTATTASTSGNLVNNQPNPLKPTTDLKKNAPVKTPGYPLFLNDTAGKKTLIAKHTDSVKKTVNPSQKQQFAVTVPPGNTSVQPNINTNTQANTNTPVQSNVIKPNTLVVKPQPKTISSMFAEDQSQKEKKAVSLSKRVHFGVYGATYFNYAKGSDNEVNIGAGVTADISISKNLKLVTGVTLAQNSLNFTGGVPTSTAQNTLTPATFSVPGANSASAFDSHSAVTSASVPAFKNYDASLVGLDVPLNLKYEFNPEKSSTYILAGVSSGTFINESYTYQYNYPALLSPSLQQVQDETSRKSFNSFYFGRTLNFAFGVGYPLGKNRLILEPFLKYPLDGLGSQNIRFGAGGVNLKFNFQTSKK